jgi:hypothetical protein
LKGVSFGYELPLFPKVILPNSSCPKHMEKELEATPFLAKVLGTDTSSIPSPNRPFGAPPSKKVPVWLWPQLQQSNMDWSQGPQLHDNLPNKSDHYVKNKKQLQGIKK